MNKIKYYCDSCKKEVEGRKGLSRISLELSTGNICREVCFDCLLKYTRKTDEIYKEMFE